MMRRRAFVAGMAAVAATPLVGEPQQAGKTARIGLLASSSLDTARTSFGAFRAELGRLGWREGENLGIEARFANEQYEHLPRFAAELVQLKVDVIFAQATPAIQAAKRATATIPIVFETLGDAVSTGTVSNLARPGGNVTGVSGFAPEINGKRLELVRELMPRATRIALLVNRTNPATKVVLNRAAEAAAAMRLVLFVADAPNASALDRSFDTIVKERSEALVLVADPMLFGQRLRIIEFAARQRLPAIYEYRVFPETGGLLSYGPDPHERYQRAAVYVDRILRGAQPGELPVEQPSSFELVLNLKTAKAIALTIPPSLLLRADQVIE